MPQYASASAFVHHERQSKLLCGVHALNSILQNDYGRHYSQADLDGICVMLDPPRCCHFNAHRHWAGLGDYDVNVLLYALGDRGLEGSWFDARQPASRLRPQLDDCSIVGLLVNGAGGVGIFGAGNHWFSIRRIGHGWYDCNSLNRGPRAFVDVGEMINDLQRVIDFGGSIILIRDTKAAQENISDDKDEKSAAASDSNGTGRPRITSVATRSDAGQTSVTAAELGAGSPTQSVQNPMQQKRLSQTIGQGQGGYSTAGPLHADAQSFHGDPSGYAPLPQDQRASTSSSLGTRSPSGSFSTASPLGGNAASSTAQSRAAASQPAPIFHSPLPPPVPVPEPTGRILTVRSTPGGTASRPLSSSLHGGPAPASSGPGRPSASVANFSGGHL